MPIAFTKYIDITSGVAGADTVTQRQLIGRLFTSNTYLPPQTYMEFSSADDVGNFFGFTSEDYYRAAFYFGWVSKRITRPRKISYSRWVQSAVAPMIWGNKTPKSLTALQAVTAGTFALTLGGTTHTINLNLSGAGSFAAVATLIQTAINAQSGSMWSAASVTYDAVRQSFNFVGGVAGAAIIAAVDGTQTPLAVLGWLSDATFANGSAVETVTNTLTESDQASDNFGSFVFVPSLSLDQATEAATWGASHNVKYQYYPVTDPADVADWSAALSGIAGCGLVVNATAEEYPEMAPMMVMAATDYTQRNATQNYMFQVFDLTPSVTDTVTSDADDALRVNYYGQTQSAGVPISFFQRGLLMGGVDDPLDMNTYANEQWLKSAAGAACMSLLLALSEVPANATGEALFLTQLQGVVSVAKFNGTISSGKILSDTQKAAILEITDDPNAWRQVATSGYWLEVNIEPFVTDDGETEYALDYTLVYGKDDTVRKVNGTHELI